MPLKALSERFSFLVLLTLSTVLLILGRAGSPVVEEIRGAILDGFTPIIDILSRPVSAANYVIDRATSLYHLTQENERLRRENALLVQWQAVARKLEQDNISFRSLLNIESDPGISFVSARVIGDSGGPFVRTLILNAGAFQGVDRGQAVVNGDGVVGRIVAVGRQSARVLLLTDLNSRVPVIVEGSRLRAILAGNNTDLPELTFLPGGAKVNPGDRIVTSGHGGLFPPGLPVGVVTGIAGGMVRVQPLVNRNKIEFVRTLRYHMPRSVDGAGADLKSTQAAPAGPARPE